LLETVRTKTAKKGLQQRGTIGPVAAIGAAALSTSNGTTAIPICASGLADHSGHFASLGVDYASQ